MPIVAKDFPTRTSNGRHSRMTDEDFRDLANHIRKGMAAGDDELTDTRSSAYQRATAAVKQLIKRYPSDFTKDNLKTSVKQVRDGKFEWLVGPR